MTVLDRNINPSLFRFRRPDCRGNVGYVVNDLRSTIIREQDSMRYRRFKVNNVCESGNKIRSKDFFKFSFVLFCSNIRCLKIVCICLLLISPELCSTNKIKISVKSKMLMALREKYFHDIFVYFLLPHNHNLRTLYTELNKLVNKLC